MPLNTLRLNEKRLHPTPHIVFIKPLADRRDSSVAHEFLSRVAAICHPILRAHHLSVTTLEEFPPNREFVGRNFNNGECIQLVLRRNARSADRTDDSSSSSSAGWLPFRAVVMVMMHELAHNVHMNHSRGFWAVRNAYAADMHALWARGYTGEGMWGPGRQAASGVVVGGGREVLGADMPDQLCGGTYRSRRAKRKVRDAPKGKADWREARDRRIAKKFGVDGKTLGEDSDERMALQGFKGPTTKSRVAGSKRARELRAAAALARFEKGKGEGEGGGEDGEDEQDYEYEDPDGGVDDARDVDGSRMKDGKGLGLIRVCEEEDADDVRVKEEMDELEGLRNIPWHNDGKLPEDDGDVLERSSGASSRARNSTTGPVPKREPATSPRTSSEPTSRKDGSPTAAVGDANVSTKHAVEKEVLAGPLDCVVCSMSNEPGSLLCIACSNVLDPRKSPGAWKCMNTACKDSKYLNPADYGICGVCGMKRS